MDQAVVAAVEHPAHYRAVLEHQAKVMLGVMVLQVHMEVAAAVAQVRLDKMPPEDQVVAVMGVMALIHTQHGQLQLLLVHPATTQAAAGAGAAQMAALAAAARADQAVAVLALKETQTPALEKMVQQTLAAAAAGLAAGVLDQLRLEAADQA